MTVRGSRTLWVALLIVTGGLAAACAAGITAPGAPDATREPNDQSFGPAYPSRPAEGHAVRVDTATLSDDHRVLTIAFVGGPPYLATDPCSRDYEPWVAVNGDALDLTVIDIGRGHVVSLPPNGGCTLEGHGYTYHLALAQPFDGTTIDDLTGGTLFVGQPTGFAKATRLPPGWSLQRAFQQEPGPPPIWVEIYAAEKVPEGQPFEGPGQLVLYQAAGTIGEWSDTRGEKSRERGGVRQTVTINGDVDPLWTDASTGELLVSWSLEAKSFGLIGNLVDMTAEDLVTYAEGVSFDTK